MLMLSVLLESRRVPYATQMVLYFRLKSLKEEVMMFAFFSRTLLERTAEEWLTDDPRVPMRILMFLTINEQVVIMTRTFSNSEKISSANIELSSCK